MNLSPCVFDMFEGGSPELGAEHEGGSLGHPEFTAVRE